MSAVIDAEKAASRRKMEAEITIMNLNSLQNSLVFHMFNQFCAATGLDAEDSKRIKRDFFRRWSTEMRKMQAVEIEKVNKNLNTPKARLMRQIVPDEVWDTEDYQAVYTAALRNVEKIFISGEKPDFMP